MSEIEELPVERLRDDRAEGTLGDRLMLGLAAVALGGGLLIAVGNVINVIAPEGTAAESRQPEASVAPSRTARPSPTPWVPREVAVQPGPLPTLDPAVPQSQTLSGYLHTTAEVVLRGARDDNAAEVGRLPPDTVVDAERLGPESSWFRVYGDATAGFVNLHTPDGTSFARFYPRTFAPYPGSVINLAASPAGYLGMAWPGGSPGGQNPPYMIRSTDGSSWSRVLGGPGSRWFGSAAWGPSGWLAVSGSEPFGQGLPWLWESSDGEHWSSLGSLEIATSWVRGLVASDAGYLLVFGTGGERAGSSIWFSEDGLTWRESEEPLDGQMRQAVEGGSELGMLATDAGFVLWSGWRSPVGGGVQVAFSASGRAWTTVEFQGQAPDVAELGVAGGRLIAIGITAAGQTRAWSAALADGGDMRFEFDAAHEVGLEDLGVTSLIGDGDALVAAGFEIGTDAVRLLRTDGEGWTSLPAPPPGFGTIPRVGTLGPAGLVLVGDNPALPVPNPALWRLQDGTWTVEDDPVVRPISRPAPASCADPPDNRAAFAALDSSLAANCFGDRPLTFVTWSGHCTWCDGEWFGGDREPAWLMNPEHRLVLAFSRSRDSWQTEAVLHPDLDMDPAWIDAWVRVTGHYDDPAAQTCRWAAAPLERQYYYGREAEIENCRRIFVVTEVAVVEGPGG